MWIRIHNHDRVREIRWLLCVDREVIGRFAWLIHEAEFAERNWDQWNGGIPFADY